MRLLILSEKINREQRFNKIGYTPPYDVNLDVGDLNDTDSFSHTAFDYDVTIVHIKEPQHHSIGYYENLPKLLRDAETALQNGRSIICLPESNNFRTKRLDDWGVFAYEWLEALGIRLKDNFGVDIRAAGAGKSVVFQEYLRYAPQYHQIVVEPIPALTQRIAVVDDTEIVVGMEHSVGKGALVVIPPPALQSNTYILAINSLVAIARRYYERSQRHIPVGDAPDWLSGYLVQRVRELDREIEKLQDERAEFDKIIYVLYGTGDELEGAVALLLLKLGLIVEQQPQGSNIDLRAKHPQLGIGFAVEVTGTKGTIQKDSNKLAQAWQYLKDRVGTSEENDRLIIVANTEYHLSPNQRRRDAFSQNAVKLLGDNGVLLITTVELYNIWRSVHEGTRQTEDVIMELHKRAGLFEMTSQ